MVRSSALMANFLKCFAFLFGFIVAKAACESIMCVKCDSQNDKTPGDCEKRPPSPATCYSSNQRQFCVRVKEYLQNGKLSRFVRDCTPLPEGEDCTISTPEEMKQGAVYKTCHDVCTTDGCNGAVRTTTTTTTVFSFSLSVISIGFLLSSRFSGSL